MTQSMMSKFARYPAVAAALRAAGVDPVQYSLLLELFSTLSQRQEFEVGQARMSMRVAVGMYALLGALINFIVAFAGRPPIRSFVFFNLAFTGFLLLMTLSLESINTFLNPVEAEVLSHQPIRDKSYFAAKLTYLAGFVAEIVFPINAAPALLGLNLKDASWLHPVTYLLAAYLLGLFVAMITCGVLGMLFRVLPASQIRNW